MKEPGNDFGAEVRRLRQSMKLSQPKLAALVGMTQGWVSHIETGEVSLPASDVMNRLCEALKVPLDHFAKYISPGVQVPPPPSNTQLLPTNAVLKTVSDYTLEVLGTIAASTKQAPTVYRKPKTIHVGQRYPSGSFALVVDGNSCEPHIPDGSTVVVVPSSEPVEGLYNVVRGESGYMLKLCQNGNLYRHSVNGLELVELDEETSVIGFVDLVFTQRPRVPTKKRKSK
jgi:transcriptional regulator with XRE-family HTH domain